MNIWVLLVTWFCQTLLSSPVTAEDCLLGQGPGECIPIQQCPALNTIFEKAKDGSGTETDFSILRRSVCAKVGGVLHACCPRSHNSNTQRDHTTTKPTIPSKSCGTNFDTDRIVNGENAELGAWPWMVIFRAIQRRSTELCKDKHDSCSEWAAGGHCQRVPSYMLDNCTHSCNNCPAVTGTTSNWICGGVLITEQYVLTAAHCFNHNPHIEFVRIGEFDLTKDPDTGRRTYTAPSPQDIKVESVIIHPKYESPCSKCNDIALVKLVRPAQLHTFFVQPICLPSNAEFSASNIQKKVGWAAGWGVTDQADIFAPTSATILQQANMTIQEKPFCHERKANYPDSQMILCAGQGDGKDTCRGDSGGPLMLTDNNSQRWYVVGVTSFGATVCGTRNAQAIFTNVHHYSEWINQNVT